MISTENFNQPGFLSPEINKAVESIVIRLLDKYKRPSNEIILDDVDLREMLKISRRTALTYRQSGKLIFYKVENKIFYFLSDILNFIKSNNQL